MGSRKGGKVHTYAATSRLCSAPLQFHQSHRTDSRVSHRPPSGSSITESIKRWLGPLECHGNVVPPCVWVCVSVFCARTHPCANLWMCLNACVSVQSRMCFSILGSFFFSFFFFSPLFPPRRHRRCRGVSPQWQRENRQEEQRAKRMTVPSRSFSVNTIISEPGSGVKGASHNMQDGLLRAGKWRLHDEAAAKPA